MGGGGLEYRGSMPASFDYCQRVLMFALDMFPIIWRKHQYYTEWRVAEVCASCKLMWITILCIVIIALENKCLWGHYYLRVLDIDMKCWWLFVVVFDFQKSSASIFYIFLKCCLLFKYISFNPYSKISIFCIHHNYLILIELLFECMWVLNFGLKTPLPVEVYTSVHT